MDDKVKMQIAVVGIDALFKFGLPAMANLISSLNDKELVTFDDIEKLKGELDASSYFESD